MAALVGRAAKDALLKTNPAFFTQQANYGSIKTLSKGKMAALAALGTAVAGGVGFAVAVNASVLAHTEILLHPPKYPWSHGGVFSTLDRDSVRRGYEVYKQVCAACHSMKYLYYRQMIGEVMSEAEVKQEAAEAQVRDGPNPEGKMFVRPGKPFDRFPAPYENAEEAKHANNGAEPPDLTLIVRAREGGGDYIFSILTGYSDPPAGIECAEGQSYNPYFPGGLISMAKALYNEVIEYEDGTPATGSQMAKDVVTFLTWAGELEHDKRKELGFKAIGIFGILMTATYWFYRHKFSYVKSRRFALKIKKK